MGRKLQAFSRYRPRFLTLLVVLLSATMLVLANLSPYTKWVRDGFVTKSYGWPITWHRFVLVVPAIYQLNTVGWYLSAGRLAVNLLLWLMMLAAAGLGCEWLLRRYRPRFRWSLRVMLTFVALLGACCAWLAAAIERANLQDELVAATPPSVDRYFYVERWGPKWLDLLGVDRYRRYIVDANVREIETGPEATQLFDRLVRLPKLRSLSFASHRPAPEWIESLNKMPHLKTLEISHLPIVYSRLEEPNSHDPLPRLTGLNELRHLGIHGFPVDGASLKDLANVTSLVFGGLGIDDSRIDESLRSICQIASLEHLVLADLELGPQSLAQLAALTNLKTLCLYRVSAGEFSATGTLPRLPRLEALELTGAGFLDDDLRELVRQPKLKALALRMTSVTPGGLSELERLNSLEGLALAGDEHGYWSSYVSALGLRSLVSIKRLGKLHLGRSNSEFDDWKEVILDDGKKLPVQPSDLNDFEDALRSLRQSRPRIVIDGNIDAVCEGDADQEAIDFTDDDDWAPTRQSSWFPTSDAPWLTAAERAAFEAGGGWARFDAAGQRDHEGKLITVSF